MFKRSISRRAAVLIAGTTIASTVYAQGAAASPADQRPTPQGQSGVAVGAVAPPAVQPASDQAPDRGAVSPRSHTFKHCGNRRVCIFRGANYRIWKVTFGANYAGVWRWILISDGVALRHYSAKNRFGNRRLLLRGTRADGTWRRYCLNPKTNRPGPLRPGMLQFKIGAVGSRC